MQALMKPLVVLALLAAGALAADQRAKVDAANVEEVQRQLTNMLAASKDRLRRAERHHQRTVDKQRAGIAKDFDAMAGELSGVVTHFEASLVAAEAHLEASINASEAEVKRAAKVPGADDWQGTAFEQKVRLGAQAAAARRNLRHLQQSRATEVHLAEHHAEEVLEDEAQSLGLVVGDLSEELQGAKAEIEGNVTELEESGNMTRDAVAAVPKAAVQPLAKTGDEEKHVLAALETSLAASVKESKVATAKADQALAAALAAAGKTQQGKTAAVVKVVKESEHKEVVAVSGGKLAAKPSERKPKAPGHRK